MKKDILVTGSHRSGTTWTGKIISKGKGIRYVHEPFNIEVIRRYSPLSHWFECINDDTSIDHQKIVNKYLDSFRNVLNGYNILKLRDIKTLKGLYGYLTDTINCVFSKRTVFKDPIAIMSTEWIYHNLNMDIVVLIRHPAAFVASLKVKDWSFDFSNFLDQSNLIDQFLKDYEKTIKEFSAQKKDIIDQGILLWNIIHEVILYFKSKYAEEWYFVKHEDLSDNPIFEFEQLFSKINLTFNSKVRNYIYQTSHSKTDIDIEKKSTSVSNVQRNSKENIKLWKKRLSGDEINRIKTGTQKIWKKFYTEDDW
jgi:hypothetical protein